MISTTFALASLLASVAVAQPHRHQQLHQRDQDVDWVTELNYVTENVDVTETVWVSSGFVPPTTSSPAPASTTSSSTSSSSSPVAEVPAQFYQGSSSSSSVYVAPTTTSVAPTTTAAPAPATSSASSDDSSSSSSGGASSGCTSGSPCEGDITYYQAGLGACGWTNDGDSENVVALPVGLMGSQSNGNSYCGQTITIKCIATGKTTTAKVVDKCMGCQGDSIDLSNAAFLDLDDLSVGRTTAQWYFN